MTQPLIIFGTGTIAAVAHDYFSRDSNYDVVAFTVDAAFLTAPHFQGLPVVPFDDVAARYPPAACEMFIALSYAKVNQVRRTKYLEAKALGYRLASYISSKAIVLNEDRIGENAFILEHNTIQPFATIGHNVTLWSGNHIGHHAVIHDHCFIASHVVVSGGVEIHEACFVGVNATIRDHVSIGASCVIGAGALLLTDAEPHGVYVGTGTERSRVPSHRLRHL